MLIFTSLKLKRGGHKLRAVILENSKIREDEQTQCNWEETLNKAKQEDQTLKVLLQWELIFSIDVIITLNLGYAERGFLEWKMEALFLKWLHCVQANAALETFLWANFLQGSGMTWGKGMTTATTGGSCPTSNWTLSPSNTWQLHVQQ